MKILITGAFGFVGTNLSAYLAERGHELWALDVGGGQSAIGSKNAQRSSGETGGASVCLPENAERRSGNGAYARCFGWDELDAIPWDEVEAVVHLAGKAHDTRNASDPQSYFDVNVGLTKKIISALVGKQSGIGNTQLAVGNTQSAMGGGSTNELMNLRTNELPKVILFSSVKAVADRVEGVLAEDAVPAPRTPYGQSKLEAEELVRSASAIGGRQSAISNKQSAISNRQSAIGNEQSAVGNRQSAISNTQSAMGGDSTHALMNLRTHELRYYILRPCMIHGPGNKGNLNLLYGVVRRGVPWPLGAFENRRSFASIGNVCAVVEGLLTGNVAAGVYQVADDDALSTNELIELMADTMGKRARIWRVSKSLMRVLARGGDVLHLPLNSERLQKLTESYVASNKKIKAALGWEWMPVDAREGMRKTIESFGRTV
jgi:nucleoside-diphosphate-sugar epimerase